MPDWGRACWRPPFRVVIINTYFIPPHPYQILPTAVSDIVRLAVFATIAVLVSSLSDKRRRAEHKLRQREEHFRLLIENTSDIVTILDADGVVRYQSPSLERDLGYAPDELVGQNVFLFIQSGRPAASERPNFNPG